MKQKHMNIQKNYIANRLLLEFNCYNTERIIDDSLGCVKVQTEIPKDIDMISGEFVDMETEGNIIIPVQVKAHILTLVIQKD